MNFSDVWTILSYGTHFSVSIDEKILANLLTPPQCKMCPTHTFLMNAVCLNEPDYSGMHCPTCFSNNQDKNLHSCTEPNIVAFEKMAESSKKQLDEMVKKIREEGKYTFKLYENMTHTIKKRMEEHTVKYECFKTKCSSSNKAMEAKYKEIYTAMIDNINKKLKTMATEYSTHKRVPVNI
jgi:hypothetical protein